MLNDAEDALTGADDYAGAGSSLAMRRQWINPAQARVIAAGALRRGGRARRRDRAGVAPSRAAPARPARPGGGLGVHGAAASARLPPARRSGLRAAHGARASCGARRPRRPRPFPTPPGGRRRPWRCSRRASSTPTTHAIAATTPRSASAPWPRASRSSAVVLEFRLLVGSARGRCWRPRWPPAASRCGASAQRLPALLGLRLAARARRDLDGMGWTRLLIGCVQLHLLTGATLAAGLVLSAIRW